MIEYLNFDRSPVYPMGGACRGGPDLSYSLHPNLARIEGGSVGGNRKLGKGFKVRTERLLCSRASLFWATA